MFDICVFGDALMDMFRGDGEDAFVANCGGTALNMACCAAKLGTKVTFMGRIGDDVMGRRLKAVMEKHGIDTRGLRMDDSYFTTLSFVELNNGERSFSFARQYGADIMISPEDIDMEVIRQSRMFHYSGMTLMSEPSRSTTLQLLEKLHKEGVYICTDISYRYNLWDGEETAIRVTNEALRFTDLVKCSEEEARLMTGCEDLTEAAKFFTGLGCSLCVFTCGENGAYYYMNEECGTVPPFQVEVVDTTGAGDAFLGGFLYRLMQLDSPRDVTPKMLPQMLRFGNAAGALNIRQKGGIEGAPTLEEAMAMMESS